MQIIFNEISLPVKLCGMYYGAWEGICTYHLYVYICRDICLPIWEHGDCSMVCTMGCPKGFHMQNILPPEFEEGEETGYSIWIPNGTIQVNSNSTGQEVDSEPNYVELYGCSTWETNEKFREGADRDYPHFYSNFLLSTRV